MSIPVPSIAQSGWLPSARASAQKTQVGYWTLAFKKVYQEDGTEWGGVKPINYKAHIINAQDGLAEFQIVHSKPANNNVYDGKWNDYQNTFSVSWSTPEMYVKIGEEDKITIEEGNEFVRNYRSGLYGYTYLI